MKSINTNLTSANAAGVAGGLPARVGSRTFAGSTGMPKSIIRVICQDELYKSDGTMTYVQDIYDIPELRELGPMISRIRVHYVCEGATTNFTAKVTLMWSVLGKTWSTSADILTAQTGNNTGTISSAMTTTTQFGILMRYAVEVKNSTGAAIESGRVTAILEIELKS